MRLQDIKNMETIEQYLESMDYEEIPKQFIDLLNREFDKYSYLKSILDMKEQESIQKRSK
tara:strand:+ start:130 stop:309 length:180 start_codon:yes stop_codon:yes gene_type:complete